MFSSATGTWLKLVGLAGGLALIIWLLCWLNVHYFINPAVNAETARWQSRWDQRDKKDLLAAQQFTDEQRRIELKRQAQNDQIQEETKKQIADVESKRAAAVAASDRLRDGIQHAITELQQQRGVNTGTANRGTAGRPTSVLLSDLFGEIDAAAGNYAAEADRRRVRGLACEKAYDALRATAPHAADAGGAQ